MKNAIARFAADESGATAIEYALLASLIAVVMVTGVTALGTKINAAFTTVTGKIP